ncbi:site-specific DNA-methyltransferase [Methylorubrum extorquens]|uniref:site-specific DNA-methyltransferase n=2 Tax=Methylorubrum extorquens TaxID=408 RepID=UPI001FE0269D|nr:MULTISPECIES: DNA methyltransferase [Methylorubrum]UYW33134.1 site-specific DNA-methyltransferase [Methylorubrum extorquens]
MPKQPRSRRTSVRAAANPTFSNTFLAETIELVRSDSLTAYTRDLRQHSDKQVAQIAASLRAFGFLVPLIAAADNTIVAGHGRWLAAKHLGLPRLPVIRVEHLSSERLRAFRLADNRLAESAGWNREALAMELSELTELDLDFELELTGFEIAEIDLILDPPNDKAATDPADACPPLAAGPAVTQAGDLWQLGPHRLLCGSALEADSYVMLLQGESVRMVFSDPPYNVPVSGHVCGSGKVQHREFAMASGEMSEAEFVAFLDQAMAHLRDRLVPGGLMYLAMDHRHVFELSTAARQTGLEQINICVWNKTNAGMGSFYRSKHELIFVLRKPGAAHLNTVELGRHGRYRTNVWDYAGVNTFGRHRMQELSSHPTVKPVALVIDAIKDCTRRGERVLDAFCGSGTTLIAAERAGRIGYGIELDPLYVDVAVRRWQSLTGRAAVHAITGVSFAERAASLDQDEGRLAAVSTAASQPSAKTQLSMAMGE